MMFIFMGGGEAVWFVGRVIYYIFHGLFTWLLWYTGRQVPLGIGDATMGSVLLGLMVGSGILLLGEDIKDRRNVR